MRKCSVFLALLPLLLLSCAGEAAVVIGQAGSAEVSLDFSVRPRTAALLRSFSAIMGGGEAVIDGAAVEESVSAAPGVAGAAFTSGDGLSLAGSISLSRIDEFLALPRVSGNAPLVRYDGPGHLAVSLSRETSPALLALFSGELTEYLSALMAPCATGDALSQAEYLALVSSVYGRGVAAEISAAQVRLSFEAPGAVREIRGGMAEGRRARFTIPLVDLLVLERPLVYELRWD